MRKGLLTTVALAAAAGVAVPALAADGDLDPTFGDSGIQRVSVGDDEYSSEAHDLVIDGAGRVVMVGRGDNGDDDEWGLTRLDADGQVDETFGDGGQRTDWVGNGGLLNAVALQPDGKIVVAGNASRPGRWHNAFAVGRYTDDGFLDDDFGADEGTERITDGDIPGAIGQALDVKVLSDGDIVVAGYGTWRGATPSSSSEHHAVVVRLNPDGTRDDQFGVDGLIHWQVSAFDNRATTVTERPGGRIVVGGMAEHDDGSEDFSVAQFTRTGAWDSSFSGDGSVLVPIGVGEGHEDTIESIAVDKAGRIVAAGAVQGEETREFGIVRLTPAGELDGTFGTGGIVRTVIEEWSEAQDVVVRADGRILVAGRAGNIEFALEQYDEKGALDPSFDGDGTVTTEIGSFAQARAVALSADGTRAIAAGRGSSSFAAARYVLPPLVEKEPEPEDDKKDDPKPEQRKSDPQPAEQQPTAPAVVTPRSVARGPRRCTSRRVFTINLRRLGIVKGDAVFRGKVSQQRLKGTGKTIRVDLRRLPAGRYAVDVIGLTKSGGKVRKTKRYRTCKVRR